MVAGSFLLGVAGELRRDLLGTFETAMAEMTVTVVTVVGAVPLQFPRRPAPVDVGVSLLPVMGCLPCRFAGLGPPDR